MAGRAGELTKWEPTSDMIDAGVRELFGYDPEFDNERDVVRAIMRIALDGLPELALHPSSE